MLYTIHAKNTLVRFTTGQFKNCIGIVHSDAVGSRRIRTLYYSGVVFVPIVEIDFKTVYLRGTRSMPFQNQSASALQCYDTLNENAQEFFAEKEDDGKAGKIVKFPNNTMGFIVAVGTGEVYNSFTFKPEWVNRKHPTAQCSGVAMKEFHCKTAELAITNHDALI